MDNAFYFMGAVLLLVVMIAISKHINKGKTKSYISDGLSIDESRVSILMISFVIFIGICIWNSIMYRNIPQSIMYLTSLLGGYVAGMNIVPGKLPMNNPSQNYGITNPENQEK